MSEVSKKAVDGAVENPSRSLLRPAARSFLMQMKELTLWVTPDVEDVTMGFNVHRKGSRTEVNVEPQHLRAIDGLIVEETIRIRTVFDSSFRLSAQDIAGINRMAAASAVMIDPVTGEVQIVSKFHNYSGYDDSLRFYAGLGAMSAVTHDVSLCALANVEIRGGYANVIEPSGNNSRWGQADLNSALEFLNGFSFANGGPTELTAELAWGEGAISAMFGDQTSLLTLSTHEPHPILGNGLFYKLELPLVFESERQIEVANALNVAEWNSYDTPPLFGAWSTVPDRGTVAFVGFLPNLVWFTDSATWVSAWLANRNGIAREMIENGRLS
jgi:hypothetical protein